MGALTEPEIFDCMRTNLVLAVEHCEDLAKLPAKGPTYRKLIDELKLIEGCCRQASAWREDTRWLNHGLLMAEVHKKAGGWLRGYKVNGATIKFAPGHINPLFRMLADNLRAMIKAVDQTKNQRTGRVGMILPDMLPALFRETRQHRVQLPRTSGGIIVPAGVGLH